MPRDWKLGLRSAAVAVLLLPVVLLVWTPTHHRIEEPLAVPSRHSPSAPTPTAALHAEGTLTRPGAIPEGLRTPRDRSPRTPAPSMRAAGPSTEPAVDRDAPPEPPRRCHRSETDDRYHFWYEEPPADVLRVEADVRRWYDSLAQEQRPSLEAISEAFNLYLSNIPVVPTPSETIWIAERARLNDWDQWGTLPEVALLRYLGEERVRRACTEEELEYLIFLYAEFGVLQPPGYRVGDQGE